MNYAISLSGQSYTLSTPDDAQIAAIAACRARVNAAMPQTVKDGDNDIPNPELLADYNAFLQRAFEAWATTNPGFTAEEVEATKVRAFASYAGQNPPEQIVEDVPLTGDALKAALKAYAASKRYTVETGGMTVNGMAIPTDRITQSKLSGAVLAFQAGALTGSIDWKTSSGWVSLDQASVTALASAVAMHVQAAFSVEKSVSDAIDAETITTIDQINAAAWA